MRRQLMRGVAGVLALTVAATTGKSEWERWPGRWSGVLEEPVVGSAGLIVEQQPGLAGVEAIRRQPALGDAA